jgi:hypothetical protein
MKGAVLDWLASQGRNVKNDTQRNVKNDIPDDAASSPPRASVNHKVASRKATP